MNLAQSDLAFGLISWIMYFSINPGIVNLGIGKSGGGEAPNMAT